MRRRVADVGAVGGLIAAMAAMWIGRDSLPVALFVFGTALLALAIRSRDRHMDTWSRRWVPLFSAVGYIGGAILVAIASLRLSTAFPSAAIIPDFALTALFLVAEPMAMGLGAMFLTARGHPLRARVAFNVALVCHVVLGASLGRILTGWSPLSASAIDIVSPSGKVLLVVVYSGVGLLIGAVAVDQRPSRIAIVGSPGAGKTALAMAIADEHFDRRWTLSTTTVAHSSRLGARRRGGGSFYLQEVTNPFDHTRVHGSLTPSIDGLVYVIDGKAIQREGEAQYAGIQGFCDAFLRDLPRHRTRHVLFLVNKADLWAKDAPLETILTPLEPSFESLRRAGVEVMVRATQVRPDESGASPARGVILDYVDRL